MNMKNLLFVIAICSIATAKATIRTKTKCENFYKIEQKNDKKKRNKKKDEQEKSLNKTEPSESSSGNLTTMQSQVDSIFTLMTAKIIPYIDAQNGGQNMHNNPEIKQLEDDLKEMNFKLLNVQDSLKTQIKLKNDCKRDLEDKNEKLNDVSVHLKSQETQLNSDIASLTKLSYDVDDAFLASISKRIEFFSSADKLSFDTFKTKRDLLVKAKLALEKPYDANEIPALISSINLAFSKSDKFTALSKSKEEILTLLIQYCSKTALLKNFLDDASKLNGFEAERVKKLKNGLFTYIEFDYLTQIILKNINDTNYNPIKNLVTNCQ